MRSPPRKPWRTGPPLIGTTAAWSIRRFICLYSRFWHKFLYDIGMVPTVEPYAKRTSHGMILGENGEKMSKSRGNVVNPDDVVNEFGADTMRLYEMFIGDFEKAAPWNPAGNPRLPPLCGTLLEFPKHSHRGRAAQGAGNLLPQDHQEGRRRHRKPQIQHGYRGPDVSDDEIYDTGSITKEELRLFALLLDPFAPHVVDELWETVGYGNGMACQQTWPAYDEAKCRDNTVEIAVQVNGKVRARIQIAADSSKEDILAAAKAEEKIAAELDGKQIVKEICVPGKLVNIVVKK